MGIIRVERELARRAQRLLLDSVSFCIYDKLRHGFFEIDASPALDIIEGRLLIDYGDNPISVTTNSPRGAVRKQLRRAILSNIHLYQTVQRIRGRRFSLAEIKSIQDREFCVAKNDTGGPTIVPLSESFLTPADLSQDTTVMTAGLDWDHKDLRAIWRLKQRCGFRYCSVVYDLIAIKYPHFVVPGYAELLQDYFGELIWVVDRALCISEATRRDLRAFAQDLGAEIRDIDVFPLGSDLPARTRKANDADDISGLPEELSGRRFALFVSTLEPRKNHRVLYEAWERCVRTGRVDPQRHCLVFVGRQGWAVDDLLKEIRMNPATRDSLLILNQVPDEQLNILYEHCAFTLFPSHYEGFGLPLAEALGHGKLCISSDSGALSEIGGDLVLHIDPKDALGWADAIAKFMSAPEATADWSARIREAHRPITWDIAAKRFFDAACRRGA